jgi:hypothetical protein
MRIKDILEADGWRGGFSGAAMGDKAKRAFKRRELEHELAHEDDPNFERKQSERIAWYKIPIEFKWVANENRLAWNGEKKLWYRKFNLLNGWPQFTNDIKYLQWNREKDAYWHPEKAPQVLEQLKALTAARTTPAETQPAAPVAPASKPDIKMTHLHYFPVDDIQGASSGMKKDKHGRWYLPQYNTSGAKFKQNLADLTAKFGPPQTVTLK